jgi:hypothetical protein
MRSRFETIKENMPKVHDSGFQKGKQEQYNLFWDEFQKNGTRTDYSDAFRGKFSWNDEIFKPKHPIIVQGNASYMFYGAQNITTMSHITFDVSQATNLSYAFCNSGFYELPVIDMRGVPSTTKLSSIFYQMPNITKIEKVYLHGGPVGDSFGRNFNLAEIRFEGEFVESIDIHLSPLSKESIISTVGALSDNVSGQTLTLSGGAVDSAFSEGAGGGVASAEWSELIATKPNWTIVLADE